MVSGLRKPVRYTASASWAFISSPEPVTRLLFGPPKYTVTAASGAEPERKSSALSASSQDFT